MPLKLPPKTTRRSVEKPKENLILFPVFILVENIFHHHINMAELRHFMHASLYRTRLPILKGIRPFNQVVHASHLARRTAAARGGRLEPQSIPPDAPTTSSVWESEPAIPPSKGRWKTAVLLLWLSGPAVSV